MIRNFFNPIIAAAAMLALPLSAAANVSLPALFADGMVLRQNSTVKVWGWAKAQEPVSLTTSWSADTLKTVAGVDAKWQLELPTPKGSLTDRHTITISGYNSITINNIAIGEVILCSGQSNMEWSVGAGLVGKDSLVAAANHPEVRTFNVDYRTSTVPCHNVSGCWQEATPHSVGSFSAIGYVLAVRIAQRLQVPVGIVNSSWGGTAIEAWTPTAAYTTNARLKAANDILKPNIWGPNRPGLIYNAMVAPMAGYGFSCLAWYQGEENTNNPQLYTEMLATYVDSMRQAFGRDLPLVYAQIAPFNYGSGNGVAIRERQRRALEKISNAAMVVIGELGDTADIHPRRKIEAGERFANAILNTVYGQKDCQYAAPLFEKLEIVGKRAIVSFANAEGLHCRGGKHPDLFEVSGADGVFHPATARLKNGKVELTCGKVAKPVSVRYAWSDTAMPNLFNAAGVQASCFTTQSDF